MSAFSSLFDRSTFGVVPLIEEEGSMTDEKKPKVKIIEGHPELGGRFGIILHPEPPSCPSCGSINTNKLGTTWLCNVCHTVWRRPVQ